MTIIFFPKYTYSGASSRYRTYQYIPFFEKEGIKCKLYPFFNDKHIQNINAGKAKLNVFLYPLFLIKRIVLILFLNKKNLVFIEKELIPYFSPLFEKYLKFREIKFILDYDDAVIHNYDKSSYKIIRKFLSNKIPVIQSKADVVINGSQYLMNLAKENTKKTFFIPTSINIDKYKLRKKEKKEFIIGWIGSYSTGKLILEILNTIESFCKQYNVKLHLIGFDAGLLNNANNDIVKVIPWSEETEISEIMNFDVGISPSIDTPFARGKCAFKSVQYMACAKPVVTSPVGANADVTEHNITGFHAKKTEDWLHYLEYLYLNQEIAKKMGKEGRKKIEKEFTVQVNYKKYLHIFNELNNK